MGIRCVDRKLRDLQNFWWALTDSVPRTIFETGGGNARIDEGFSDCVTKFHSFSSLQFVKLSCMYAPCCRGILRLRRSRETSTHSTTDRCLSDLAHNLSTLVDRRFFGTPQFNDYLSVQSSQFSSANIDSNYRAWTYIRTPVRTCLDCCLH